MSSSRSLMRELQPSLHMRLVSRNLPDYQRVGEVVDVEEFAPRCSSVRG